MPTPLKRQIGYKKESAKKTTQLPPPSFRPSVKNNEPCLHGIDKEPTAKEIVTWLKSHTMFKWSALCEEVGIDKGNFHRTMNNENPTIKPGVISRMLPHLKEYGFTTQNGEK